jgi:hypothetical protein
MHGGWASNHKMDKPEDPGPVKILSKFSFQSDMRIEEIEMGPEASFWELNGLRVASCNFEKW